MIDIIVPLEQEGTKAVVRSWLKKVGDRVEIDDPIVELETDKVLQEIASPGAGILAEIALSADAAAEPGSLLGRISAVVETDAPSTNDASEPRPADQSVTEALSAKAIAAATHLSPSVRRAVSEHGVDPATISGTGRGGRLTRADIDQAVSAGTATFIKTAVNTVPPLDVPNKIAEEVPTMPSLKREHEPRRVAKSVPHDRMRLAIAENMSSSLSIAPHVTAVFEADFSGIIAHRRQHKAAFEKEGVNLTYTAYFISACVAAMRAAPAINSRWHNDRLEIFDDINIGVGTALGDKGLVVPVVQRAQDLSLKGIASRLGELVGRARSDKTMPADVRGGTFTISNHGVSGSLFASPIIIRQPESAILGVGKLEKRLIVREEAGVDTIQIRPLCYVSLTVDHRVVDGHQTNAWLSKFTETLERWPLDCDA